MAFDLREVSVAPAGIGRCMNENTMLAIGSLKRRDRLKDLFTIDRGWIFGSGGLLDGA